MKDQLPRYLFPTADMKKAIDKNTKQDEDLSLSLKQLDREKKMVLKQISRKQEDFKKKQLKRRESLPQKFKVQFSGHRLAAADGVRPHHDESTQTKRLVRRAFSLGETYSTPIERLPVVINQRHSPPVSPFLRNNSTELSHFTSKKGSVTPLLQRTDIVPISTDFIYDQKESEQDDCFEVPPPNKMTANQFCTKLQGSAFQNVIRRHSDVTAVHSTYNPRLLQRRRLTVHNVVAPNETCLNESVTRLLT